MSPRPTPGGESSNIRLLLVPRPDPPKPEPKPDNPKPNCPPGGPPDSPRAQVYK
jgi:hypothetical protein